MAIDEAAIHHIKTRGRYLVAAPVFSADILPENIEFQYKVRIIESHY